MKLLNLAKLFFALLAFQLIFVSCEEDGSLTGGGGGIFDTAPTVTLLEEAGFETGAVTLMPGETFKVKLSASGGTNDMNTINVLEDGVSIDLSRVAVDGSSAGANPILLFGADRTSFTKEVEVTVADTDGFYIYTFEVSDDGAVTSDLVTIAVTIAAQATPPSFTNGTSGMITADAGTLITIPLQATAGSAPMAFIVVTEGASEIMDLSRLYYGDIMTNFSANPFPIPAVDQDALDTQVFLRVPTTPGTYNYQIFIIDANQEGSSIQFDIDVPLTGTPVDFLIGQLLNAAGPIGQGGLDLDEGISTGSNDPMAEIKDNGIDIEMPASSNWRQQIAGTNGSEIRYLIPGQNGLSETFSFNSIMFKEQIVDIFANGQEFVESNLSNELVSSQVNIGDIFIVKNGENYYIITVTNINITDDSNMDSYTVDVMR